MAELLLVTAFAQINPKLRRQGKNSHTREGLLSVSHRKAAPPSVATGRVRFLLWAGSPSTIEKQHYRDWSIQFTSGFCLVLKQSSSTYRHGTFTVVRKKLTLTDRNGFKKAIISNFIMLQSSFLKLLDKGNVITAMILSTRDLHMSITMII